jgi:hypothetical protein
MGVPSVAGITITFLQTNQFFAWAIALLLTAIKGAFGE